MKTFTFTKPTVATVEEYFTTEMIIATQAYLKEHPMRSEIFAKPFASNLIIAVEHVYSTLDIKSTVDILNKLHADQEYLQVVVGQLALRLPSIRLPYATTNFDLYLINTYVAANLLQALIELGFIHQESKTIRSMDPHTGQYKFTTQHYITFGTVAEDTEEYIHGLEQKPGVVYQKAYNVKAGGKQRKLNQAEKTFLKVVGSFELRMIQDITDEEFKDYMKSEQDMINVLNGHVPSYDRIVGKQFMEKQFNKFKFIQSYDKLYLPMWLDYRTRLYYEFSESFMMPSVAKWLWEAAEAVKVTDEQRDDMKYSAVCIIDGRMPHHEAIVKYNENPDLYQAKLREKVYTTRDLGKTGKTVEVISYKEWIYNRRLADAILADETHFLLGEDATNGGLQHQALSFRSTGMAIPANVGGAKTVQDSHQTIANGFNKTRDEAKSINQQLLHGAGLGAMAKRLELTEEDLITFIIKSYGIEALNISRISRWGADIARTCPKHTALLWKTSDGFNAQSINYFTGAHLEIHMLSNNKSGLSQTTLEREMPAEYMFINKQYEPVAKVKEEKINGLDANITHSIDATALRQVIRAVAAAGIKSALWIHDNFFVATGMRVVRDAYKLAILREYDERLVQSAISQIIENALVAGVVLPKAPLIVEGTLTREQVEASEYFLSA